MQTARPAFVHETAIVEPGAEIGRGTRVWHHVHIRAGATIGSDCSIGKNAYVDAGVRLGDRVKIQNNVSIYDGVELGNEVFVGPGAIFTNDLYPRATGDWEIVPTYVRDGATIGAGAVVRCGVEVGERAMVGAGAVVTRSVEPHELVVGNPARRLGWVCTCGRVASRSDTRPDDLRCEECRGGDRS